MNRPNPRFFGWMMVSGLALIAIALSIWLLAAPVVPVLASELPAAPAPQDGAPNSQCLLCHGEPGQVTTFPNGDPLYVSIDPSLYGASVHGSETMSCVSCHVNISGYPHPVSGAQSRRDYQLTYLETCKACHTEQFDNLQDSIHGEMFKAGNENAPTCTDCHNPHTQPPMYNESGKVNQNVRAEIPETCAKCHNNIYEVYAGSVHGSGVIEGNNPDVPTCADCHGVHEIVDPTTASFRLSSVEMCAKCHTDASIMDKYGLSTAVLDTYVADFHGTTVTLFEKQHPDEETNKPVCYDCHGVHDILSVNDPEKGIAIKQNMLVTCQRCHPDATTNFPESWLSHYIPSPDRYPLVYWVGIFYKIFIPTVLGGMGLFVATDIFRRQVEKKKKSEPTSPDEKSPPGETGEKENAKSDEEVKP
ncbi:MAG: hypothetical protein HPY76_02215 [Anaerolineae bacterium]|nr:hypothetical protein [Anaerolineae bacterium]